MKTSAKLLTLIAVCSVAAVLAFQGRAWAPAVCGNGNLDQAWEECEVGVPCADPEATCDESTCLCTPPEEPVCGDGVINQAGEECEVGVPCADPEATCDESTCLCTPPEEPCGNGVLDEGEECDPGILRTIVPGGVPCADPEATCEEDCTCTPPPGDEGCTPGYWKQDQHFGNWTAPYAPGDLFSAYFEDAFPGMTLLDVLWQGGGGLNALGRHTVAALLNAASPDVNYGLDPMDVIDMFNDVFPGTMEEYTELKDDFADMNESLCGLGRALLPRDSVSNAEANAPSAGGCSTTASVTGSMAKGVNLSLVLLGIGAIVLQKRIRRRR